MKKLAALSLILALTAGCSKIIEKTIVDNPEIITKMIEKHPKKFLDAVNGAVEKARDEQRKEQELADQKSLEEEYKNPKQPDLSGDRVVFGNKDAKVTIVEYSDFQCPYCSRGYATMKKVLEKYKNDVKIVYKHLPLDFHPQAEPAALFFEAIALQSHAKAEKFHDEVFENQGELKTKKEEFLKAMAKKVGANVNKVLKDIKSEKVKAQVEKDTEEARTFGFSGTPGFLVNGVSVKGAYPFEHFEKLIDRSLKE